MEPEAFPMKGGDDPYSYSKNSQYQREAANAAKEMIKEAIAKNFDIANLSFSSNTIRIADLGCSVGPNTFIAMQNVLEAMERKYRFHSDDDHTSKMPEFQLFFNDHSSNDFNTLFTSLPPDRNYFAAGVPGSFYGRLFPKSSLHFVYSSYALEWLSKVPGELLDKSSPAWNKGRIHYTSASKEVGNAYEAQFAKDMEIFLNARADEIAVGGMMILVLPAIPDGAHCSQSSGGVLFDILELSLNDMVKVGSISEAELDSFNFPVYFACPTEMSELVERNGRFSIERRELTYKSNVDGPVNVPELMMHMRAAYEGIFIKHFGSEIIDELFERAFNKAGEFSSGLESTYMKGTQLFLALKRK